MLDILLWMALPKADGGFASEQRVNGCPVPPPRHTESTVDLRSAPFLLSFGECILQALLFISLFIKKHFECRKVVDQPAGIISLIPNLICLQDTNQKDSIKYLWGG